MKINTNLKSYIATQVPLNLCQISHNGNPIDVARIIVDGEEYKMCECSSTNMWANKKKGKWGGGYKNTKEDPRRVERTGRLGEMAFSKISNTPVDFSYIRGGDKHDTIFRKKSINVKTAMALYGVVMVKCEGKYGNPVTLSSDFYVFCCLNHENRKDKTAIIDFLGYLPLKELITKSKVPKIEWVNYECPYNELHTIEELLKLP